MCDVPFRCGPVDCRDIEAVRRELERLTFTRQCWSLTDSLRYHRLEAAEEHLITHEVLN